MRDKIEEHSTEIFGDTSKFLKKMMLLELYRGGWQYLNEGKSDYILLDMGCLRYDICHLLDHGEKCPISINSIFQKYYLRMMEMDLFPKEYIRQDITTIDDAALFQYLDEFVDKLKQMYDVNKIILFETQGMYEYLGKDGKIYIDRINESDRFNEIINKGYDYIKNKLYGCHIVRFPKGVLGDEAHIWGQCNFHYVKEYYEYAYDAMKCIVENSDNRVVEEVSLMKIKEKWEDKIERTYHPMRIQSYKKSVETVRLNNRRTQYLEYIVKCIADNKSLKLKDDVKTVAFYGLSQIARMLIPICKKKNFSICYIVEDGCNSYDGIMVLPRNTKEFPPVDCMIIADLRVEIVRKKLLNLNVDFEITDIYEIIGEKPFLNLKNCY